MNPCAGLSAAEWFSSEPSVPSVDRPENDTLVEEPQVNQYGNIASLHVLFARDARADADGALSSIQRANEARREAWERQLNAMREQEEAEDDSGFWGDVAGTLGTVAKVAGCVAAVAVAVGTAGAGAPVACLAIAGALASCTSAAQSELGVLDGVLGEETADTVGQWLGIGGAVMSGGAGAALWLGSGTQAGATAIEGLAGDVLPFAMGIGGVSAASAGAATIAQANSASEARRHYADVVDAMADQQRWRLMMAQLLDEFRESQERETANVERVVAMNSLQNTALLAATNGAS